MLFHPKLCTIVTTLNCWIRNKNQLILMRACHDKTFYNDSNLNNKRLMQGYISSMCVCVCLWLCLSALDLRNGGTYEYQIWTANSCDNTGESEVILLLYFKYFWNKLQFTKYRSFLYISKTVIRTNSKFRHSIAS